MISCCHKIKKTMTAEERKGDGYAHIKTNLLVHIRMVTPSKFPVCWKPRNIKCWYLLNFRTTKGQQLHNNVTVHKIAIYSFFKLQEFLLQRLCGYFVNQYNLNKLNQKWTEIFSSTVYSYKLSFFFSKLKNFLSWCAYIFGSQISSSYTISWGF